MPLFLVVWGTLLGFIIFAMHTTDSARWVYNQSRLCVTLAMLERLVGGHFDDFVWMFIACRMSDVMYYYYLNSPHLPPSIVNLMVFVASMYFVDSSQMVPLVLCSSVASIIIHSTRLYREVYDDPLEYFQCYVAFTNLFYYTDFHLTSPQQVIAPAITMFIFSALFWATLEGLKRDQRDRVSEEESLRTNFTDALALATLLLIAYAIIVYLYILSSSHADKRNALFEVVTDASTNKSYWRSLVGNVSAVIQGEFRALYDILVVIPVICCGWPLERPPIFPFIRSMLTAWTGLPDFPAHKSPLGILCMMMISPRANLCHTGPTMALIFITQTLPLRSLNYLYQVYVFADNFGWKRWEVVLLATYFTVLYVYQIKYNKQMTFSSKIANLVVKCVMQRLEKEWKLALTLSEQCLMCSSTIPDVECHPCGHVCICIDCASQQIKSNQAENIICVHCKVPVKRMAKFYRIATQNFHRSSKQHTVQEINALLDWIAEHPEEHEKLSKEANQNIANALAKRRAHPSLIG